MNTHTSEITIRLAYADDHEALMRLAALDSARHAPPSPLVIAEVGGELRAALSLHDGSSIADPFHPTLNMLDLLRTHAAGTEPAPRRVHRRYRLRFA